MRTLPLRAGLVRSVRATFTGACLLLVAGVGCKDLTGSGRVASVEVGGPTNAQGVVEVQVGQDVQLTARALNSSGKVVTGKRFEWSSSDDAVATVSADGVVTGKASGPVTITARTEGKSGSLSVTVLSVPVASVAVSPDTAVVAVGQTRQLQATPRDAAGNPLSGRQVAWSSSNDAVATVSPAGLVTARTAGAATITARSEGKEGRATVTVFVPQAARVVVSPAFVALDVGGTTPFRATALTAGGDTLRAPAVSWSSTDGGVLRVDAAGSATGASVGVAQVAARVDAAADTAVVAVLGSRSLLSTAFPGGSIRAAAKPGQTVSVPVTLDLSRVSADGDLGSVQFDLAFDTTVLRYDSATAGVKGATDVNLASPGRVRFAFAGTVPQGSPRLTLVTLHFRVPAGAPVGAQRELGLTYPVRPTSTTFSSYDLPITVAGRIRVAAP